MRSFNRPGPLTFRLMWAGCATLLAACAGTPSVEGVRGTAPTPNAAWTPPPTPRGDTTRAAPAIPADLESRIRTLTLSELVDVALRNNTATAVSWNNARAAADAYGAQRGTLLPTIDGDVTATRLKTVASQGRTAVTQTTYGPGLTLSYLVFDIGGRSGAIDVARQALLSADWTHNATIQNVVLQVEAAYFDYLANKGLLNADSTSLHEAQTSLEATQERQRVGLATIADVLQAKTAFSQAQLNLETTEGTLLTARGALAVSLGVPANLPYDSGRCAAAEHSHIVAIAWIR